MQFIPNLSWLNWAVVIVSLQAKTLYWKLLRPTPTLGLWGKVSGYSVHVCHMNLQFWTKVLGTVPQYSYYSVISGLPLKTMHPFQDFLAVLPPTTLYKVETRKKFWINACNIVCGVRGGVGPVWIGKRPRKAKVSQDFCPWLSEKEVGRNKAVLRVFQACKSVFSTRFLMKDRNWTNLFPAFRSFLNVF